MPVEDVVPPARCAGVGAVTISVEPGGMPACQAVDWRPVAGTRALSACNAVGPASVAPAKLRVGRFLGGWLAGLVVGGFWVGGLLSEAKGAV